MGSKYVLQKPQGLSRSGLRAGNLQKASSALRSLGFFHELSRFGTEKIDCSTTLQSGHLPVISIGYKHLLPKIYKIIHASSDLSYCFFFPKNKQGANQKTTLRTKIDVFWLLVLTTWKDWTSWFFYRWENQQIYLPSGKLTVRPWKSPSFLVNTIKTVDFPWRFVSLQEGMGKEIAICHCTLRKKRGVLTLFFRFGFFWISISLHQLWEGWREKSFLLKEFYAWERCNSLCGWKPFSRPWTFQICCGSQPCQCRLMALWRLMGVMTLALGSNASCWSNGSWEECCTGVPRKRCWNGRHQQLLGFA